MEEHSRSGRGGVAAEEKIATAIMRTAGDNREAQHKKDSTFFSHSKPVSRLWKQFRFRNSFHVDYSNNLHKQSTKLNDFFMKRPGGWVGVWCDDKIAIGKHFARLNTFSPTVSIPSSSHHFRSCSSCLISAISRVCKFTATITEEDKRSFIAKLKASFLCQFVSNSFRLTTFICKGATTKQETSISETRAGDEGRSSFVSLSKVVVALQCKSILSFPFKVRSAYIVYNPLAPDAKDPILFSARQCRKINKRE